MEKKNVKNKIISTIIDCNKKKFPFKAAIDSPDGQSCTFNELYLISKQLNEDLKNVVKKDSRIAVIMSMGFAYSLLTIILTTEHVVLPLNLNCSINEFHDFFKRFKINAIFIDHTINDDIIGLAKKNNISVLKYERIKNNIIEFDVLYQGKKVIPDKYQKVNKDTVFILPTSGTTAKPKIVCLSNANVFYSAKNICKVLKLTTEDVCLNVMPLFHVHGLMVLVSSLFMGARTIATPKYSNQDFFSWLYKFKPTWYTASAGIQENILLKARKETDKLKQVNLRFIRSSSAPLSPQTTSGLEAVFNAPIAESYGMTEACLQITSQPLFSEKKKIGSCGKAAGVELIIVDKNKSFLKKNKVGEIIIKGQNIIKGYEDNDKENEKSFWNGWFLTGDLGYLDEDGFLFIKGRIKEMINKGGENISPREVDEVLMSHEAVELGVAFAMPHKTLGEEVAAAIILKEGHILSEKNLRLFIKPKLAIHKVPSKFFFVADIPRTPVGKPKRVGLYLKLKNLDKKENKIRNSVDLLFIDIWENVLNIKVNIEDNYFELGGDSLQAQEIINKLNIKNLKINYSDIQNYPTIKQLTDYVTSSVISENKKSKKEQEFIKK